MEVKGQGETEDGSSNRASSLVFCCQFIAYFIIVFVSLSINTDMILSILKSHCLCLKVMVSVNRLHLSTWCRCFTECVRVKRSGAK